MKVLSIEQMTRLKELGVDVTPKGTCLMYTSDSSDNYYLKYGESTCEDDVVAFSLQDLIELLPKSIIINSVKHWFCVSQNCLLTEFQVMYRSLFLASAVASGKGYCCCTFCKMRCVICSGE